MGAPAAPRRRPCTSGSGRFRGHVAVFVWGALLGCCNPACQAEDVNSNACWIGFGDAANIHTGAVGCQQHPHLVGWQDDSHYGYDQLGVGRSEEACLARADAYFAWCGNRPGQRIFATFVPTGAMAAFPPETNEMRESEMRERHKLGAPWPLPCILAPHRGSPRADEFKERPVVVGSLVWWLNDVGFDERDLRECQVPCVILSVPSQPNRQCVEQLDLLLVPMGIKPQDRSSKPPWQKWAYFSMESGEIYPEMDSPEHMANFDLEISYRKHAHLRMSYAPNNPAVVRAPPRGAGGGGDVGGGLNEFASDGLVEERGRDGGKGGGGGGEEGGFILYLQSNCVARSDRDAFVSELMRFVKVDSMGKCLHNTPYPAGKSQLEVLSRYKFVITFENSKYPDYVTERIFNAWIAGSVPIYSGAPNIEEYAPAAHSYIDARDFIDAAELAQYLLYLHSNETARQEYLRFKDPATELAPGFIEAARNSMFSARGDEEGVAAGQASSEEGGDEQCGREGCFEHQARARVINRGNVQRGCRLCLAVLGLGEDMV